MKRKTLINIQYLFRLQNKLTIDSIRLIINLLGLILVAYLIFITTIIFF